MILYFVLAVKDEHRLTPLYRTTLDGHVDLEMILIENSAGATVQDKD